MELTREQARRGDGFAMRELGIPSLVLMENAGRGAAEVIRKRFAPAERGRVVILCGTGNNGGDGLVVARHLASMGARVEVDLVGGRDRMTADAATQLAIVLRMGLPVADVATDAQARAVTDGLGQDDVVVDALFGTGFRGEVRAPASTLIDGVNRARRRAVVALDLPSGLDCDSGRPAKSTVRADLTVTFVAPKAGFSAAGAAAFTGEVIVRDIGVAASWLAPAFRT